jgi:hypothetical protein
MLYAIIRVYLYDMKSLIKKLLRENLLDEVSDELYGKIKKDHSNDRIIMSKDDSINFNPTMIREQRVGPKPSGLWYGIGDSWIKWVKSEMEDWEYDNVFKVNLNEKNILKIPSIIELRLFDKIYGVGDDYGRMINWVEVAKDYDGIEIAPYIIEARFEYHWYYGWDVASGCIWNKDAITSIDKLGIDNEIDEGFLSSKIGNGVDKFKESWGKFMDAANREKKETYEAAKILRRLLNPKTKSSVTDDEIKFLKSQSKDLLRIAAVGGLGVVSMAIPIALEKILNKYGKTIMPGETKIGDSEK